MLNLQSKSSFDPAGFSTPCPACARRKTETAITLDGVDINIAVQPQLIEAVIDDAVNGRGGTVFTVNLDHMVKLTHDAAFHAAYKAATYVTADGAPIVWMARQKGVHLDRVTGSDLVRPLVAAAAVAGVPIHFFGTRNDVLVSTAIALTAEMPSIEIAGMESPPFGFSPFGADARAAAERIAASGARICFVALGAPKQEIFANFARQWAPNVTFLCIGAGLDFIGGDQVRAPQFMRSSGLEWLWRCAHDPRRLAKRYLLSALYFAGYEIGQLARWLVAPFRHNGSSH